jgi:hypothetical protein
MAFSCRCRNISRDSVCRLAGEFLRRVSDDDGRFLPPPYFDPDIIATASRGYDKPAARITGNLDLLFGSRRDSSRSDVARR